MQQEMMLVNTKTDKRMTGMEVYLECASGIIWIAFLFLFILMLYFTLQLEGNEDITVSQNGDQDGF